MHQPVADADVLDEARRIADVERLYTRARSSGQPTLDRLTGLATRATSSAAAVILLHGATFLLIAPSDADAAGALIGSGYRHLHQRVLATGAAVMVEAASASATEQDGVHADGVLSAYLGVPLLRPTGAVLGVLAVQASGPRRWSDADRSNLDDLAALAVDALEAIDLRHGAATTDRRFADLVNSLDAIVCLGIGRQRRVLLLHQSPCGDAAGLSGGAVAGRGRYVEAPDPCGRPGAGGGAVYHCGAGVSGSRVRLPRGSGGRAHRLDPRSSVCRA